MFGFGLVLDIHRSLITSCKIVNRDRSRTGSQRVPITCLRFANRGRSRTESQRVPNTCLRRRSGDVSCLPMKFMSIQATVDGFAQRPRVVRRLGGQQVASDLAVLVGLVAAEVLQLLDE